MRATDAHSVLGGGAGGGGDDNERHNFLKKDDVGGGNSSSLVHEDISGKCVLLKTTCELQTNKPRSDVNQFSCVIVCHVISRGSSALESLALGNTCSVGCQKLR